MKNDNRIEFTGFLRELLLKEICEIMHIIIYCECMDENVYFGHEENDLYRGRCLWCGTESYLLDKTTGFGHCESCGKKADFLEYVSVYKWNGNLARTMADMASITESMNRRRQSGMGGAA